MKHGFLKKWLALLLAIVMLGCMAAPALAARSSKGTPVIFIPDMTEIVLYQNPDGFVPSPVFNWKENADDYLREILSGLIQAKAKVDEGANKINGVINEIFRSIQCDENGNSRTANVGPIKYYRPVEDNVDEPIYTENIASFVTASQQLISADRIFVYNYDWRLDSYDNAAGLKEYIDNVRANTGCKKVSVVSGGYGGIVANTYLYFHQAHAKKYVASCVFLDSLADGSSIIGDVMSGDLIRTVKDVVEGYDGKIFDLGTDVYDTIKGADVGDALLRYISTDPTGLLSSALESMLGKKDYNNLIVSAILSISLNIIKEEGLFTDVGKGYREILMNADEAIYNGGLREKMRNMPGLWAAVPNDSYQQALYFMYGNDLEIPAKMLAKIERSNKVLKATEQTLQTAMNNGVNVCVVAGYNLQILPITSSLVEQSDGLQATRYAGLGATTGDMKHNLKRTQQCGNGNHNHMEPGRAVDASTCYLPESTWFIKDHQHLNYRADTASAFLVWLVTGTSQRTIWKSNLYPQYLQVNKLSEQLSAYSDPVSDAYDNYMYGDLDVNGHVDTADARIALRYAIKLEKTPSRLMLMIGDVDHSNRIDTADARLILRYAIGLEASLGRR